jgi:serine/threonine protein kinase
MTTVGTPLYMAPEVGDGRYDSKVDVYSFGLIMYEIVTNDPVFSSQTGNKIQLFTQLVKGWRPDLSKTTPLSRSVIERSWSLNANERPTFKDIWRQLYVGEFKVILGVKRNDVDSFLTWIEGEGVKVDRFDSS